MHTRAFSLPRLVRHIFYRRLPTSRSRVYGETRAPDRSRRKTTTSQLKQMREGLEKVEIRTLSTTRIANTKTPFAFSLPKVRLA